MVQETIANDMSKIHIPSLDTRLTVLCDLTSKQILTPSFIDEQIKRRKCYSLVRIVDPQYGAANIQSEIYRFLAEVSMPTPTKYILVLRNNLQITSLSVVLMNGNADRKLPMLPVINPKTVRVWEVWDDSNILISESDGLVTTTSFDEAFRPIVSDIMRLQRLNAPDVPKDVEDMECPVEYFTENTRPKTLERAVADEGMVANSPQDIIRARINAAQERKNVNIGDLTNDNE